VQEVYDLDAVVDPVPHGKESLYIGMHLRLGDILLFHNGLREERVVNVILEEGVFAFI